MSESIKLNLGCYDKKMPGFINVDIREEVNPDVVDDAFRLQTFDNESVELIYASHMLEHLNYNDGLLALQQWYAKLKPNGVLRLAVPDFEAVCKRYIYTGNIEEVLHSVNGSQKHEFDFHYNSFDFKRLSRLLVEVGFTQVQKYNWFERDPHRYCDDYSQAYLPAKERTIALSQGRILEGDGILMSLNVEAVK